MAKAKKSSGCPTAEAAAKIEKMNQDLDKQLAKDEAKCKKQLEAATAKAKAKPTVANKSQVEKTKAAIVKAADEALVEVEEEITGLNHMLTKCSKFIKRRALEAKLLEKFRKDEAKTEALNLKKKSKPKTKKKVTKKAVVNTESAPSAPTTEENTAS